MKGITISHVWLWGAIGMLLAGTVLADSAAVQRTSRGRACFQADDQNDDADCSIDGNVVAFSTHSDNLDANDTNGTYDVYVYTVDSELLELISHTPVGIAGNGNSENPAISANGRYVAFESNANNLVDGDTNGVMDIFVYDRQTGVMERVSMAQDGTESDGISRRADISADGNLVVFDCLSDNLVPGDTNGNPDVFLYNRKKDTLTLVSHTPTGTSGNGASLVPRISADGKQVVFESDADNLVDGDGAGWRDVFLYEVKKKTVERISVDSNWIEANGGSYEAAVSADGRYVAFESGATNLVDDDTNGNADVFVRDREVEVTFRVSEAWDGTEGNGNSFLSNISDDGAYVLYYGSASNLAGAADTNGAYDVFLSDRNNPEPLERTNLISRTACQIGNDDSWGGSISGDGTTVVYVSNADNLVPGDTNGMSDIFQIPWQGTLGWNITRCSVGSTIFSQPTQDVGNFDLSDNGRYAVFDSTAPGLVPVDTNGVNDVFLHDRLLDTIQRVSTNENWGQGNAASSTPRVAVNRISGPYVAFASNATNLVDDDTNARTDIFIRSLLTGGIVRITRAGVEGNNNSSSPDIACSGLFDMFVCFQSDASNLLGAGVDTNGVTDIFVFNVNTTAIERVSLSSAGAEADDDSTGPSISDNGRYVAFQSLATTLLAPGVDTNGEDDIYVYDRTADTIERVSVSSAGVQANSWSSYASISADGRYVCFSSNASNLIAGDTNGNPDVFVRDRDTDTTTRVSVASDGSQATGGTSGWPMISTDGRFVAFASGATNLVDDDTNGVSDVFVHDLETGRTIRMSGFNGNQPNGAADARQVAISEYGRHVAFASAATNMVIGDTNGRIDLFTAANPLAALTPGRSFPLIPEEIDGFTDLTFARKPKLAHAYVDPIKGTNKTKTAKVLTAIDPDAPPTELTCAWLAKIALFDKKDPAWKSGLCRDALATDLIDPCEADRTADATLADGTHLDDAAAGTAFLVPPEITQVMNAQLGTVIDAVSATDQLWVMGGHFGNKPPKAWLEYQDAKGKFKQAKCKVLTNRYFADAAGKPDKSCMDPESGFSWINVQMPAKWPKGWIHGRHDLVIDNGCGRTSIRLLTEE